MPPLVADTKQPAEMLHKYFAFVSFPASPLEEGARPERLIKGGKKEVQHTVTRLEVVERLRNLTGPKGS